LAEQGFAEMYRVAATIVLIALVLGALGGCESNDAPPGTPGSITASVHGRTEVIMGGSTR
jgi:hypothetical protein